MSLKGELILENKVRIKINRNIMVLEGNEIFSKAKRLYKYIFVFGDFFKH